jgi:hypothetical protein
VELLSRPELPRLTQGAGTYQRWPSASDRTLPPTLTVRQAYRFVKLAGRALPLRCRAESGETLCVRDARLEGDARWRVRCADGWLRLGERDAHVVDQGSSSTLPVV